MCVAAVAWHAHPRWTLVAIGNRDEYHARDAAPLATWDDDSGVLGGRDLVSGGTWLGVTMQGRFALVTNRRGFGDPDPSRASRGALVTDALAGSEIDDVNDYNPFNLIIATASEARFLANRPLPVDTPLASGIYGLSNGALDEPWSKTLKLKAALLDWLGRESLSPDPLFAALADEALPDIGLHPDKLSDVRREAQDTAPFIRDAIYGTRCSTAVCINAEGAGRIIERRFDSAGNPAGETALDFVWPAEA